MPKIKANFSEILDSDSKPTREAARQEASEGVTHPRASSFAARFGRVILRHGIAAIPSALYHFQGRLNLYAQHVWFVSYILSHKWDEDLPYPSLGVMARCSGMSKRQLQRYSDELQRMGYLHVYQRVSTGRGQEANAYDFAPLFEHLEHWIAQGQPLPNTIRGTGNVLAAGVSRVSDADGSNAWAERDPSFVARYGRVISSYGVAAVPRAIFTHQNALGIGPQQVWFATYIFSYQWDTALPYPSIVKMAEQTGYTSAYLHRIKGSLVEKGYLRLVHRTNEAGGQDSNAYDFSGLLDAIRVVLQPVEPPEVATTRGATKSAPLQDAADSTHPTVTTAAPNVPRRGSLAVQARRDRANGHQINVGTRNGAADNGDDIQYTDPGDIKYTSPSDAQYTSPSDNRYAGSSDAQYICPSDVQYIEARDNEYTEADDFGSPRLATSGMQGPMTGSSHEEEADYIEINKKNSDSNHPSTIEVERIDYGPHPWHLSSKVRNLQDAQPLVRGVHRTSHLPYSSYIAQVITDFSNELQDSGHVLENVSQALRLWRASGLADREFVDLLYEGKRRTRLGQSRGGAKGLSNKMAYYFTCVRDLCAELQNEG